MSTKPRPKASGLGLEGLNDLSSLLDANGSQNNQGGHLELPLDFIDEDPSQPREADNPGFSEESLQELGKTIKQRGLKQPISVRENPEKPGYYIINQGARRFRASLLVGKKTIRAVVDNNFEKIDQTIENLQRENLTALEIAKAISTGINEGKSKGKIAEELGKSPAFISQHLTLLNLPEPIAEAFRSGRTKDVTLINELVKLYKKSHEKVSAWLANEKQELTRGTVQQLRELIDKNEAEELSDETETEAEAETSKEPKAKKTKRLIVQVKYDNQLAHLILDRLPSAPGLGWLELNGDKIETKLTNMQLVALLEK